MKTNYKIALLIILLATSCTEYISREPEEPTPDLSEEEVLQVEVIDVSFADEVTAAEKPPETLDMAEPDEFEATETSLPEVQEVIEVINNDGPCVPNCQFKECGPDGCGGLCGYCLYGYECDAKQTCVKKCDAKANCAGKTCGPDGCGGTCPPGCSGAKPYCDPKLQICTDQDCFPSCEGKECGDDGCDLTNKEACGKCAPGYVCTEAGLCGPSPCFGIDPIINTCSGKKLLKCINWGQPNEMVISKDCSQELGSNGKPKICGYNDWSGYNECIDQPPCVPKCNEATEDHLPCGNGGCPDQPDACGICPYGWGCPGNYCRPVPGASCGYIPQHGYCWWDNTLFWCTGDPLAGGKIAEQKCDTINKKCAWNDKTMQYECR